VSRAKKPLAILGGYLALTLLLSWPLAANFTTAIPGDGFDGWQNYWNLWWMREAVLCLQTSPFFTYLLYYPTGASLLFHTLNPFNGLLTMPLQLLGGVAVAYNLVVLFSFVVGGFGAYLLALQTLAWTGQERGPARSMRLAAFVAGIVYTFSPFHFAHLLGHMQVLSLEWLPFYVLYLLRAWQSPQRRWGDALKAGFFLALTGLCDWYYVLYLLLFTALAVVYFACRRARMWGAGAVSNWGYLLAVPLIVLLLFAVALSPLLVPMVLEARGGEYLIPDPTHGLILSADLLAFFTPPQFHPLWGQAARAMSDRFASPPSEHTVFAGYVPLLLGLAALVALWREPLARFWGLNLAAFFILALGPVLHVGGRTDFLAPGLEIPLPYRLVNAAIPFMYLVRSLSRFDVMVMLSLGVLVALGLRWLSACLENSFGGFARHGFGHGYTDWRAAIRVIRGKSVLGFCLIFICLEFLAVPYPLSPIDTPPFFHELAQEPGQFAVVALPMDWDRPNVLLYQTVHGKPLISAYTSRTNPLSIVERTPLFQHWRFLGPDIIEADLGAIGIGVLNTFDVRYVVLDMWQMPPGPEREATLAITERALAGAPLAYEDGRLVVYRVPQSEDRRPFVALGEGWGERRLEGGRPFRFVGRAATLKLYGPGGERVSLVFTLDAPPRVTALKVRPPGGQWASYPLSPGRQEIEVEPLALPGEESVVYLQVEGAADERLTFRGVRLLVR
jgi:hypothetical protein